MYGVTHWVPRPSFQTRLYHLGGLFPTPLYHPALAGTPPGEGNWNYPGGLFPTPLYHLGGLFPTPLYHLGGLFPTPLYHLHPCRCTSL